MPCRAWLAASPAGDRHPPRVPGRPRGRSEAWHSRTRPRPRRAPRPHPDADHKPDSPTDIERPGWRYTAKAAFAEFQRDQCTDLAAALTYYSVLSVFPAILALVSLLGVFGRARRRPTAMLDIVRQLGQAESPTSSRSRSTQIGGARGAGIASSSVSRAPSGRRRATSARSGGR